MLSALPARRTPADHVAVLLGPEGGWTADERRARQRRRGGLRCRSGPLVLRARETAAAAALAVVGNAWMASGYHPLEAPSAG